MDNQQGLPRWLRVTNPPATRETWVSSLSWEDTLEKGMTTHSRILARESPWTEEFGELQSMGHKESDTTEWLKSSTTNKDLPCRHGALLGVLCQLGWEGVLGKNGYMCIYGWVPYLFTWNHPSIVNQIYPSTKQNGLKFGGKKLYLHYTHLLTVQ